MITPNTITTSMPSSPLACYDCGEVTTLPELTFVDDLIEHSPFFCGISENFAHCIGDDPVFHDNIVNCCAGSYAQIVQSMATWDDDGRKREIGNLARALRAHRASIPARVAINAEHLLATLIAMGRTASLADEDVQEALYCDTSPLHAALDAITM